MLKLEIKEYKEMSERGKEIFISWDLLWLFIYWQGLRYYKEKKVVDYYSCLIECDMPSIYFLLIHEGLTYHKEKVKLGSYSLIMHDTPVILYLIE